MPEPHREIMEIKGNEARPVRSAAAFVTGPFHSRRPLPFTTDSGRRTAWRLSMKRTC